MNRKQKKVLCRILASAMLSAAIILIPVDEKIKNILFLIPYLLIGYDILTNAIHGIISKSPFDENFLMTVATVGAMILGENVEGVAVMLFYQTGELFQSVAVRKSRRNIASLMDIRPDVAVVKKENGELCEVSPDEVEVGTVITVSPGGKIPIDGIVINGSSSLDTAALTGESIPRDVEAGDEVISGCINVTGVLEIKTTKKFGESTVSKILDLVENAGEKKSKSEKFISKFARVYTPVVCISALALALLPPLICISIGGKAEFGIWVYRALTFLVISCPCALVISIPLTFFAGIGGASRNGILIKGSEYIEKLSEVNCVVFDKTGTLTCGTFEVIDVQSEMYQEDELISLVAHAEMHSAHPIAKGILSHFGNTPDRNVVSEIEEIPGCGTKALVSGKMVHAGNSKLMEKLGIKTEVQFFTGTCVYVAIDCKYAGYIVLSDKIKTEAKTAISALRDMGIKKTVMLTGDVEKVGTAVSEKLGIDDVRAELLPQDKVSEVEKLIKEKNGAVAYVGDGINDAPVLAMSDVGIAMGALGSDAAVEASDIVIMDDNPIKIPTAVKITKKCMRIVRQNIFFSIGIKLLCLVLGAAGIANMWFAIFADVGVMVLAVLNAMRALYIKNLSERRA